MRKSVLMGHYITMDCHLSEDQIEEAAVGRAKRWEAAHILNCPRCSAVFAEVVEEVARLRLILLTKPGHVGRDGNVVVFPKRG